LGDKFDRMLFRLTGPAALVVLLAAVPAQVLHPRPEPDVDTAFLEEIDASGVWVHIHLLALFAYCVGLVILFAIYRSVVGDRARLLATFGLAFALIGTALTAVWTAIDGVAMAEITEDYWAASGATRDTAFLAASAVEEVILALWSLTWVFWFGIPFLLFGSAVAVSDGWSARWGWAGVFAGASAFLSGFAQLYTGRHFLVSDILMAVSAILVSVWLLVTAFMIWRKADELVPSAPAPSVQPVAR
jgi:hypothetical protein